jgi:hypothetical protein
MHLNIHQSCAAGGDPHKQTASHAMTVVLEIIFPHLGSMPVEVLVEFLDLWGSWTQPETSCTVYMPHELVSNALTARNARKRTKKHFCLCMCVQCAVTAHL